MSAPFLALFISTQVILIAIHTSTLNAFQLPRIVITKQKQLCTDPNRVITMATSNPTEDIPIKVADKPTASNPWYSDASLKRDREKVMDRRETKWESVSMETSRFILVTDEGMYHERMESETSVPSPLFFTFEEVSALVGKDRLKESLQSSDKNNLLAWVGEHDNQDYWVYATEKVDLDKIRAQNNAKINVAGLREFGDSLLNMTDAAILGTCNGLVEFHKSHSFCSKCGNPTRTSKAGGSRKCTSKICGASVYPRIDTAAIMIITTQCENYALLGRKSNWPQGRYSTLAGFAEIGETMEQCCVRETLEESGIVVDPGSMTFVCSQPWPFPRSLMVGFRAKAQEPGQPSIRIDELEMEDIRWFPREYVRERIEGGSTAMNFQPNEKESEFHIPGPASLGRMLITQWANEI